MLDPLVKESRSLPSDTVTHLLTKYDFQPHASISEVLLVYYYYSNDDDDDDNDDKGL